LRFAVKRSPEQTLVFVTGKDGEPVAGASVTLAGSEKGEARVASGPTDADGLYAGPSLPGEVLAVVSKGADAAPGHSSPSGWGAWEGEGENGEGDAGRVFAFTDRPVYRPGQSANVKIVARLEGERGYSLPQSGTKVTATLENPRGEALQTR